MNRLKLKSLGASILLHVIAAAITFLHIDPKDKLQLGATGGGNTDKPPKDSLKPQGVIVEIVKFSAPSKKKRKGYYGIGIYTSPLFNNMFQSVIDRVVAGYPAEQAGMLPGDIIIECDGHTMNPAGHITSNAPTVTHIKVSRNGIILSFTIKRDFIYTD